MSVSTDMSVNFFSHVNSTSMIKLPGYGLAWSTISWSISMFHLRVKLGFLWAMINGSYPLGSYD